MGREDKKNMMPEEEYLKQMSSLPKVKAPEDFLKKVHERIERRSAFEKIMRTLFVPVKIKVPLEAAAMTAVILIIATIGINKPAELSLLVRPQEPVAAGAMRKSVFADSMKTMELKEKAVKEEVMRNEAESPPAQMPCADETLTKVKNAIEAAGGRVANVEVNKDAGIPRYIDAEILAANYAKFVEKLAGIGALREPAIKKTPPAKGIIRVRIKLLSE